MSTIEITSKIEALQEWEALAAEAAASPSVSERSLLPQAVKL